MREGYSVTVSKWGEDILTIEHSCLSGQELSEDDTRAIRDAGEHLKSFAGDPDASCAFYRPDLMAGGTDCAGCGFTFEQHQTQEADGD